MKMHEIASLRASLSRRQPRWAWVCAGAIAATVILGPPASAAPALSFNDYMQQVTSQNESFRANIMMMRAYELRMVEGGLDFMPNLTGAYTYTDNRISPASAEAGIYFGTETLTNLYNLGVQKKFRTGTSVTVGYQVQNQQVYGSLLYPPNYDTASPTITISQPLWRDWNASLSKANEETIVTNYRSLQTQARYAAQQLAANAENAYWTVALDRQIVAFDKDGIDRTTKIMSWNKHRVQMNVADRSDLLQSQASVKNKELLYETDVDALRQACLKLNSFRNVSGNTVIEELQLPDAYLEKQLTQEVKRIAERADVTIAEFTALNAKASAKFNAENIKPTINVTGSVQFNGRGIDIPTSLGTSWNSDNPVYTAGLSLKVPLDGGVIWKINQGYEASAQASDMAARRAKFDLDQDWLNLQKSFGETLRRFQLAKELEQLEGDKLSNERTRFTRGRTTSFQVLTFEDSFSDAQVSRLRVEK